ncbi:MAG TPA: PQQ-dependent sugar dehydrogenase [Actinomycetota bacterium]|nr:PQQ-dependent sugar dehydrogenase [Actinomycetota bacterium]
MTRTIPVPQHRRSAAAAVVTLLAATLLSLAASPASAASLPVGFTETSITGLVNPTAMELAPDGRIFVTQQGGALRVIKNGVLLPNPFLTLSVDPSGERGLLGVAFDPNFATNNFVYVYYTVPGSPPHNRVSRFTANGDVAVAGSEVPILDLENLSSATNHNGGAIHFGPDGKLYVAVGENANPANAQTLSNRLGKMLRINADGTIPTDNPFVSSATGDNRAIWALGLRNPFTFAFQPGTGRMFVNDVGQSAWEEVNDGIAGSNYGWPTTEGPTTNASFRSPLFAYGHGSGLTTGCAIAGGAFYNPASPTFPASYAGRYFFADLCSGWIRSINPSSIPSATDPATAPLFASGFSSPVDLKVTPAGSLLVLTRGNGAVTEIRYQPPTGSTVKHPSSTTISAGTLRSGSAADLAANDGRLFQVNNPSSAFRTSWYATMTGVPNSATNLRFAYSGSNSVACAQTVAAFNFSTRTWVTLDTRSVGPSEVTLANLSPAGNSADFVSRSSGLGDVRLRVFCKGSRATGAFFSSGDLVELSYTG